MKTKWMMIPMVLLMMGCTREKEYGVSYIDGEFTLYANFGEHETRTQLQQDGSVFWNPGDCINVFYGSLSGKFASSNTEPSDYAEFTGLLGSFTLDGETEFVAAYPYSEQTSLSDGTLRVSLPSEQVAVEGSFADDLFISVAKSKDYNLYFYNVCGGVKFSVADEGIKKVVFRGNGGESLAGRLAVGFSDGKPQVSDIDGGKTSVTLTAPDDGTFKPGAFYYFVLAPQALQNGYTMAFYSDVLEGTVSIDSPVTIRRSAWGVLRDLVPEPPYTVIVPEAVDLGLPSGLKWASFNLGASTPEEYGDYFAWGDIEPYYNSLDPLVWKLGKEKGYAWSAYKWSMGSITTMIKYCEDALNGYNGFTDGKSVLDPEDDAAHVLLGEEWRMPTREEQDELRENCSWEWTKLNGEIGYRVTGPSGNSIFFPVAGHFIWESLEEAGTDGHYWASSLSSSHSGDEMCFDSDGVYWGGSVRSNGLPIRPVYSETKTTIITSTPTNIGPCSVEIPFTVSTTDTVKGFGVVYSTNNNNPVTTDYGDGSFISVGTSEISSSMIVAELKPNTMYYARAFITLSEDISGHSGTEIYGNTIQFTTKDISYNTEYVDLGLSVKWATCNLGSSAPHDVGAYYAWGETVPTYMRSSYKWSGPDGFTKYNAEDGMVTLEAADDAAFVNLGDKWRMPTNDEITELRNNCTWAQETRNGVLGCRLTGPNGNSIFIPVSKGHTRYFRAEVLSSSLNSYYEGYVYVNALSYNCNENLLGFLYTFRDDGTPVRPVYDDSSEMPEIEVTPTDIDFGAVPYGTSSTKYVTVKNIGTGVLTFSVTNVSSPYSVETNADGSPKDYSLSAGESMQLAFTFTPNSATYMGGGRCTIVSNATESPISVTYSGQGAEPRQVAVPEAVDLGLSVQWASFNLGAARPEEYGDYYAWGETEPYYSSLEPLMWKPGKEAGYDWPSYNWCMGADDTMTKYCTDSSYGYNGLVDGKTCLDPEDDAAYMHLGGYWRMPTEDEIEELYDILRCSWELTSLNGVKGYKVTGHYGGNSIFLPCAGRWNDVELNGVESEYWTSTLYEERPRAAYYWQGYSGQGFAFNGAAIRSAGLPIRPVYDDPDYNPGYVPVDPPEGGLD